jgi:asparagine synthase (glutamine-hydrolysing)
MLGRLASTPSWSAAERVLGNAAFGWRGRAAAKLCIDGPYLAVVDGHFYNGAELGDGDEAALLIALYRQHGFAEALTRINGDFAVALFDADSGSLWLGRDRFGVKPLYYAERSDMFAFASRPRALLTLPGMPDTVNSRFVALFAASHYRTFDNAPEQSPYAAIAQLPAAHALELRRPSHRCRSAAPDCRRASRVHPVRRHGFLFGAGGGSRGQQRQARSLFECLCRQDL